MSIDRFIELYHSCGLSVGGSGARGSTLQTCAAQLLNLLCISTMH